MFNLYCGDCLDVMKEIPDSCIDLVLTDPPYGTTACKWDSVIPFEPMWEQLKRVIKMGGAIVLFGSEPFSSHLRMSNIKQYKYDWVWEKTKGSNFMGVKYVPWKMHENISVFNACGVYNPQKYEADPGKVDTRKNVRDNISNKSGVYDDIKRTRKRDTGLRYPKSVQKFKNPNNRSVHPTQKPVPLMEYLIRTYTHPGETVLDFTMGSGTTGVAARRLARYFIGIELDPGYFEIAKKRIEDV